MYVQICIYMYIYICIICNIHTHTNIFRDFSQLCILADLCPVSEAVSASAWFSLSLLVKERLQKQPGFLWGKEAFLAIWDGLGPIWPCDDQIWSGGKRTGSTWKFCEATRGFILLKEGHFAMVPRNAQSVGQTWPCGLFWLLTIFINNN